jgi:hypothetical protein
MYYLVGITVPKFAKVLQQFFKLLKGLGEILVPSSAPMNVVPKHPGSLGPAGPDRLGKQN